jgi:hypothetical protein
MAALEGDKEELEELYDDIVDKAQQGFDSSRENPSDWHSDLLSLALHHSLYSFAKEKLEMEENFVVDCRNQGRPYLHYLFKRHSSFSQSSLEIMRMLLSISCRPDCEFNPRTTWE